MEAKKFDFDFKDVQLDPSSIIRLLGYPEGYIPDHITGSLNEILAEAPEHFRIRGGYVIYDIAGLDVKSGTIKVDHTEFNPGRIICRNLKHSDKAIFFLLTAGNGVKDWTNRMMEHDPIKGYMIDLLGSLVADGAVDLIERHLETNEGLNITNRYSPGYCGWKLVEQKMLFSLFPENFCDIKLTPSSLMLPIKSVSGIIGTGKNVEKKDYECEICDARDCIYRNLRISVE
jgi:hypothetical protein